jgi:signal transduction histidine kinase
MSERRGRILVAEDSPTQAAQMQFLLEEAGYVVQLVPNGSAGLLAIRAAPPDVVLSDIVMPEMDGFAFCRAMKATESTRSIPFVMLTSLQTGDEKTRALEEGADDLLTKPADRPELLARVRSLLRRKELHDEVRHANAELRTLTVELEARVAERTAALQATSEQVAAMSQQLWQTAKLATMGELAASIAHEINNPLATVTLRIDGLLAQTDQADPRHRSLEIVVGELDRMAHLVANLLQFSRRSSHQISSLDLGQEISASLELVRSYLRNRAVQVIQDVSGLPLVPADRQLLRQLFLNLITNAADAMPGGGNLTIRAVSSDQRVVIEFADTGVGIAAEDLARVREAFFTTKPEGQGTGLGLAICQRIVQQHHGDLEIRSQLGLGTTIRILLPLSNGHNAAEVAGGERTPRGA